MTGQGGSAGYERLGAGPPEKFQTELDPENFYRVRTQLKKPGKNFSEIFSNFFHVLEFFKKHLENFWEFFPHPHWNILAPEHSLKKRPKQAGRVSPKMTDPGSF